MSEFEKLTTKHISPEDGQSEQARIRNNVRHYKEVEEKITYPWAIYNCHLLSGRESYQSTFKDLFPKKYINIREYIENVLREKKGNAIGLDIGGVGSTVFEEFSPGFFSKTAGVCLRDTRHRYNIDVEGDEKRNHSVIEGDIASKKTRQKIAEWSGGQKIDLVFERMAGGLDLLSKDPRWVYSAIQEIYKATSENGLIFLQLSFQVNDSEHIRSMEPEKVDRWVQRMNEIYPGCLDVVWNNRKERLQNEITIRIRKLPGAPESLPDFRKL